MEFLATRPTDPTAYEAWFARLTPRQQHAAWFAGLPATEQAKARTLDLDRFLPAHNYFYANGSEDALDNTEAEPIPEAIRRGTKNGRKPVVAMEHPVLDKIDPQTSTVPIDDLSESEINEAVETFETALRWGLSAEDCEPSESELVHVGKRSSVIIATMRPDMATGLKVEPVLARLFVGTYGDVHFTETVGRLSEAGDIYGRILSWMRKASSFSGFGERLQLVAYDLRPDLIDGATFAKLGEELNKTRQAKSKVANCLRDTFSGLRAITQRPDVTRLRCMHAQRSASALLTQN